MCSQFVAPSALLSVRLSVMTQRQTPKYPQREYSTLVENKQELCNMCVKCLLLCFRLDFFEVLPLGHHHGIFACHQQIR